MNREKIKKVLLWLFLSFFIFSFFRELKYNQLYYDNHELYPTELYGYSYYIIVLLVFSFIASYLIFLFLQANFHRLKFLKPTASTIKSIFFLLLYLYLMYYLGVEGYKFPSGFIIGGTAITLVSFFFIFLLPLIVYIVISYFYRFEIIQRSLKLNWSKFFFSIALYLILARLLSYSECTGYGMFKVCKNYYFPFYTYYNSYTDIIMLSLPNDKLLINSILGTIAVFPLSFFLSFVNFKRLFNFEKFTSILNFINPNWDKILILLLLIFILSVFSIPIVFSYHPILLYGLLWYALSCLIIYIYNKFKNLKASIFSMLVI